MAAVAFGAVLCDLDGVLRVWDSDVMPGLDRAHGVPEGTLAGTAFAPERLLPAITGVVTDEEWRAGIADALAETYGIETARALVGAWTAIPGRVDERVRAILAEARRLAPVVLVSNATTRLERDLDALGLSAVADAVVNTSRIGVAKPDPEVYALAAQRAGVSARRCLFVDDTPANVTAATAAGMTGHHYRGPGQLRTALARLG